MLHSRHTHLSLRQRPFSSPSCGSDNSSSFLSTSLVCSTQQTCISSSHQRPRPGRRRKWGCRAILSGQWLSWTWLMLAIFSVGAEAASRQRFGRKQHGSFIRSGDPVLDIDTTSLLYHDVPSEILFDTTPQPGTELRLRPRQAGDIFVSDKPGSKGAAVSTTAATDQRPTFSNAATAVPSSNSGGGSSVVTPAPSRTSIPTSGGSSSSPNSVETGIVMQPGSSATDLPKVFEGGFGTNYTESSCPAFLTSMIKNQTFTDCLPFSLLLQVCTTPVPSSLLPPPQSFDFTFLLSLSLSLSHPKSYHSNHHPSFRTPCPSLPLPNPPTPSPAPSTPLAT